MALLPILCYPDSRLHKVAKPVTVFDERLKQRIADMLETMYDAKGIGLAATQVDHHERLIVIDVSEERDQPLVLINPEIVWASEERQVGDEGCLSVPGIYDGVERSVSVRVKAQDGDGHWREMPADWGNPEQEIQQRQFFDILEACTQHLPAAQARLFKCFLDQRCQLGSHRRRLR